MSFLLLALTNQERQDHAWRLTIAGKHSKAEVAHTVGVSEAQVAIMRRVKRTLGASAYRFEHWRDARKAAQQATDHHQKED